MGIIQCLRDSCDRDGNFPRSSLIVENCFTFLDSCIFHKELRINLPMSVKNCVGILVGIALNLCITFGKMTIFTMLILPINEHGRSFHLLRYY